jgi:hypothetical protein
MSKEQVPDDIVVANDKEDTAATAVTDDSSVS